jgi:hypothetical protein
MKPESVYSRAFVNLQERTAPEASLRDAKCPEVCVIWGLARASASTLDFYLEHSTMYRAVLADSLQLLTGIVALVQLYLVTLPSPLAQRP